MLYHSIVLFAQIILNANADFGEVTVEFPECIPEQSNFNATCHVKSCKGVFITSTSLILINSNRQHSIIAVCTVDGFNQLSDAGRHLFNSTATRCSSIPQGRSQKQFAVTFELSLTANSTASIMAQKTMACLVTGNDRNAVVKEFASDIRGNVTICERLIDYMDGDVEASISKVQLAVAAAAAAAAAFLVMIMMILLRNCLGWRPCCFQACTSYNKNQSNENVPMKENTLYEPTSLLPIPEHEVDPLVSTHENAYDSVNFVDPTDPDPSFTSVDLVRGRNTYVNIGASEMHSNDKLVIASITADTDLAAKVAGKAHLVLYSDYSCTLGDILDKAMSTVPAGSQIKHVAFMLRHTDDGLLLSSADGLVINCDSVSSDSRLKDFFLGLVNLLVNTSSKEELRIDFLNEASGGTERGFTLQHILTDLLKVPVILSSDLFGASTVVNGIGSVADLYFDRRRIGNSADANCELPEDKQRSNLHRGQPGTVYYEIQLNR